MQVHTEESATGFCVEGYLSFICIRKCLYRSWIGRQHSTIWHNAQGCFVVFKKIFIANRLLLAIVGDTFANLFDVEIRSLPVSKVTGYPSTIGSSGFMSQAIAIGVLPFPTASLPIPTEAIQATLMNIKSWTPQNVFYCSSCLSPIWMSTQCAVVSVDFVIIWSVFATRIMTYIHSSSLMTLNVTNIVDCWVTLQR